MSARKTIPRTKPCVQCGQQFSKGPRLSNAQWRDRKFCSQRCSGRSLTQLYAQTRASIRDNFDSKVQKSEGCWNWQGTIEGYGYGVLDHNRKRFRAHVLALEYDGRPVPTGMIACHHCDNPRCVRPEHLYVGTPADNARDARERNLLRVGENHPLAKLTEAIVREIRASSMTATETARKFGISRPHAKRIMTGQSWRGVR